MRLTTCQTHCCHALRARPILTFHFLVRQTPHARADKKSFIHGRPLVSALHLGIFHQPLMVLVQGQVSRFVLLAIALHVWNLIVKFIFSFSNIPLLQIPCNLQNCLKTPFIAVMILFCLKGAGIPVDLCRLLHQLGCILCLPHGGPHGNEPMGAHQDPLHIGI